MRFRLLPLFIILCLLVAGCIIDKPEDEVLYQAQRGGNEKQKISIIDSAIDTCGLIPFITEIPANIEQNRDNLVVSISPDHNSVYIMRPSIVKGKCSRDYLIKGVNPPGMSLLRVEVESGHSELISPEIPVVSLARWDADGNILALLGGNLLTLYDSVNNKVIIADELQNEQVSHFAWSPDGKKYIPNTLICLTAV